MSGRSFRWALGLLLVFGLPLLGWWARRGAPPRCALDGAVIEPLYRVRVEEEDGRQRLFCSVRCAQLWLARGRPARAVFVTDEASGREVEASRAFFVRSAVVTPPTTRNHTHAFADRADAERHATAFRGMLLPGPERPFGVIP